MGRLDWSIIVVYLLAVVSLGVAAGFARRKGEPGGEQRHYFLAGNTLAWPIIGLAMFAANISTVHLISLAEAAYKYGLVFGNFEWMAGFTLILLALFFAPLYLRSKVATLPDFLERRFNRGCRDEIPNPNSLRLRTLLNGQVMQDSSTEDMIFDVPTLIEFLSGSTTLLPGTVILTGTPQGVGMAQKPPRWLRSGDSVRTEVEKIGTLTNPVQSEQQKESP